MLYLPPGYQSGSKLPMLVEVYGGPGFQKVPIATIVFPLNLNVDCCHFQSKVDKQWQGYNWPSYVAGTLGIVYAVIGEISKAHRNLKNRSCLNMLID